MKGPRRIQRKRTRGWRMPEGVVYVGRPSLWGNPWSVRDVGQVYPETPREERAAAAVRLYRRELEHWGLMSDHYDFTTPARWEAIDAAIQRSGARNMGEYAAVALRGKDLACWCPLDQACHADVLLELANR